MTDNNISLPFFDNSTPIEYLELMYANTDDGILYIPGFACELGEFIGKYSLRCKMNWEYRDYEKISKDFITLNSSLKKIAEHYDEIAGSQEKARELLSRETYNVWCTYIKDFDTSEFDLDEISAIEEKLDTIEEVKKIAKEIYSGNKVNDIDKEFLNEYMDLTVTSDEKKLYDKYGDKIYAESESRVGKKNYAYQVVIRAKRLCRLYSLNAPDIVTDNEGRFLVQAIVLHNYCTSTETVDYTILLNQQKMFEIDDDELDDYFKPKKENSRKMMRCRNEGFENKW